MLNPDVATAGRAGLQLSCHALQCMVGCATCLCPVAGEDNFAEASDAYEAAGEVEAVVRLSLDKLRNPHKAAALARRSRSVGAAALVAQYCVGAGDFQVSAGAGMMFLDCGPACPCRHAVSAGAGMMFLGCSPAYPGGLVTGVGDWLMALGCCPAYLGGLAVGAGD